MTQKAFQSLLESKSKECATAGDISSALSPNGDGETITEISTDGEEAAASEGDATAAIMAESSYLPKHRPLFVIDFVKQLKPKMTWRW